MKRKLSAALIIALVITMFGGVGTDQAYAKSKKVKLSTKKVTVYKGKTKTIKLKNVKKKVKWKIKNKKVAKIVKKSGKYKNKVKIKGLKKGSTKIIATYGKKKFTAKIVVKKKKSNTNVTEIETTTPASTDKAKIVGKVTNTKFTYYGKVYFQYALEGDTNDTYTYGMAPGKLEIMENGTWKELTKKPATVKDIAGIVSKDSDGYLEISLQDSYEGVREGHYKYTHIFSGIEVPIEFDFEDEANVVLENDKIPVDGILSVTYSYKDKREFRYFNTEVGKLEIYEDGQWTEMTRIPSEGFPPMTGGVPVTEAKTSFVLKDKFENIRVGHYRYTVSITDMPIEFDIVE